MANTTALVIDDEADIRELVALTIQRMGFDCHVAANLEEARNLLSAYEFDICLTDMKLPDGNGVDFVKYIQSVKPQLPVAVITAHGNLEAAVEAMKNGAYDFVSKPVDIQLLRKLVVGAVSNRQSAANDQHIENSTLESNRGKNAPPLKYESKQSTQALIGESEVMCHLRETIVKVARSNAPVWITGESGTGKEMIARLIHSNSARADHPFVPINCGAIPTELVESELFGHVKGSFTGAVNDNIGLIRQAEGGTLFLDEVAELPLHMQVKLLRAIQEKSVRPVGDKNEISVDVRILSASHKDLALAVDQGQFRHDLYYRLNVISLRSPTLAERVGDLNDLTHHLLAKICDNNHRQTASLTPEAIDSLKGYPFPGNVRELENILERALAMTDGDTLDSADLQLPLHPTGQSNHTSINADADGQTIELNEKELIIKALNDMQWNRKAAATKLGMSYRQMRYRIERYGIGKKPNN